MDDTINVGFSCLVYLYYDPWFLLKEATYHIARNFRGTYISWNGL